MDTSVKKALQLIILFGLVSLFGDMVYEGARSVNGPYLKTLGANAVVVGLIGGLGEFIGYAIRLVAGYFADRTKAYWAFTFIGYGLLISVPLLSLTGIWQVAAVFIVCERLGKALRSPAKDTLLSQAAKKVGTGFGFGLNEAMDQIGALIGPLLFTGLFLWTGGHDKVLADYQRGYALLWIPFIFLMGCVLIAFLRVPSPEIFEEKKTVPEPDKLSRLFWLYSVFTFIATSGFVSFILVGFHLKARGIMSDAQIPFFYAVAMIVDGLAALMIGIMYDRIKAKSGKEAGGLLFLAFVPVVSAALPFLLFSQSLPWVVVGVVLWGIVMAAHETIVKSSVADLTPLKKRGTGYGVLNATTGVAMLLGGGLMGWLYEISIPALMIVTAGIQFCAMPVYFAMAKEVRK